MRIKHVIPNSNKSVIEAFIKFINDNYSTNEHTFDIVSEDKIIYFKGIEYKNVNVISFLRITDIIKIVNNNDKVIFHYLKLKTSQMFLLLFYPKIFKKVFWVAWGADLYQWKNKPEGNILRRCKIYIRNAIAFRFRERIKYFVGIFPPDIDYFKKEFKSDAKTFYASYVGGLFNDLYTKRLNLMPLEGKILNSECINIQIGHSSTSILNHIDVLENLVKYKNENIKIYIPLSYGNKEYGDRVQEVAIQLFRDKVVCIREMMDKDDYMKFLSTIDIAIFNTTRQIGLGNITPLLYMEKKIYIPKGTVMYDFYKAQKINICDYSDINKMNYDSFIEPVNMNNAKEYVTLNSLNKEKKNEMWNNVFNAPLK